MTISWQEVCKQSYCSMCHYLRIKTLHSIWSYVSYFVRAKLCPSSLQKDCQEKWVGSIKRVIFILMFFIRLKRANKTLCTLDPNSSELFNKPTEFQIWIQIMCEMILLYFYLLVMSVGARLTRTQLQSSLIWLGIDF